MVSASMFIWFHGVGLFPANTSRRMYRSQADADRPRLVAALTIFTSSSGSTWNVTRTFLMQSDNSAFANDVNKMFAICNNVCELSLHEY